MGLDSIADKEFSRRRLLVEGVNAGVKGVLVLTGLNILSGACDSKENSLSYEPFKICKQKIECGQYESAINILINQSSDNAKVLFLKYELLGEAYYGLFKKIVLECPEKRIKKSSTVGVKANQEIWEKLTFIAKELRNSIHFAEDLNQGYQGRKWKYFLKFEGQAEKCCELDTPIKAIKTAIYSGLQRDITTFQEAAKSFIEDHINDVMFRLKESEKACRLGEELYKKHGESQKKAVEFAANVNKEIKKRLDKWKERPYECFEMLNPDISNVFILDTKENTVNGVIENARKDFIKCTFLFEKTRQEYNFKNVVEYCD
ncbi:hypothetical protein JW851_00635 [Candidatus Woesearchaeota archaeon]|nr:hypothetical protein [Candidatus Woesearchaeota archaeon]